MLLFGAVALPNAWDYWHLNMVGMHTSATVTAATPENHNGVDYEFTYSGLRRTGSGYSHGPNPPASGLSQGDRIAIVFDPANPSDSCACDPNVDMWSQLMAPFLAAFVVGSIAFGLLFLGASRLVTRTVSAK